MTSEKLVRKCTLSVKLMLLALTFLAHFGTAHELFVIHP